MRTIMIFIEKWCKTTYWAMWYSRDHNIISSSISSSLPAAHSMMVIESVVCYSALNFTVKLPVYLYSQGLISPWYSSQHDMHELSMIWQAARGLLTMHLWSDLSTSSSYLSHSPIVLTTLPLWPETNDWLEVALSTNGSELLTQSVVAPALP